MVNLKISLSGQQVRGKQRQKDVLSRTPMGTDGGGLWAELPLLPLALIFMGTAYSLTACLPGLCPGASNWGVPQSQGQVLHSDCLCDCGVISAR